mmetsp:Transcript_26011/g.60013  ORF Transcript_26011/g.60013 Transcript_26011/m.60013 type:complete len:122 (-) Transcript_26011:119-484(-)
MPLCLQHHESFVPDQALMSSSMSHSYGRNGRGGTRGSGGAALAGVDTAGAEDNPSQPKPSLEQHHHFLDADQPRSRFSKPSLQSTSFPAGGCTNCEGNAKEVDAVSACSVLLQNMSKFLQQ